MLPFGTKTAFNYKSMMRFFCDKLDDAIKDFEELNHLNNIALLYEMFEK